MKPQTRHSYTAEQLSLVQTVLLDIVMRLNDFKDDLVLVGGLVPSLLIPQHALAVHDQHPGTNDLDIGLSLALLDEERYKTLGERLRAAGFSPQVNAKGNQRVQTWHHPGMAGVLIDLLVPEVPEHEQRVFHLEPDLGAFVTPGLELAFQDFVPITITGSNLDGARASRTLKVCGPGAFVVLKSLALRDRVERKDAFDLCYLLKYHDAGPSGVATKLKPLLDHPKAREAMRYLSEDFSEIDSVGPISVSLFELGARDDATQADAMGLIKELLRLIDRSPG